LKAREKCPNVKYFTRVFCREWHILILLLGAREPRRLVSRASETEEGVDPGHLSTLNRCSEGAGRAGGISGAYYRLCVHLRVAILRKEPGLELSLTHIPQILSVNVFGQPPLAEVVAQSGLRGDRCDSRNRLMLLGF
jgi:hypothetical protein